MAQDCPCPDPLMYDVDQPLVMVNETSELSTGNILFTPGLASNWTASANGSVYTFDLRQNVNFSNGDPFNAYQVWMQMYLIYYLSDYSPVWSNYPVFNMSNVNFGPNTISLFNQTGNGVVDPSPQALSIMMNNSWPMYVTGPYSIVFHLAGPFLWLPAVFSTYVGLIWDSQYVLTHLGGPGTPTAINTNFDESPVPGTGPYMVTGISNDNYIEYSQNPTYWGDSLTPEQIAAQPLLDPGHVKNVIVYYKADDIARYTDLEKGAVQIADISTADFNLVEQNPALSYFKSPPWNPEVSLMAMNTQLYPTNITDVRQAIVHAINYSDLYGTAWEGQMSPFMGPEYPAWSQFYDLGNYTPYQYNVTLANQYLAKANITNMPVFNMKVTTDCDACEDQAEVIQGDLANIGITVSIELVTNAELGPVYSSNFTSKEADPQIIGQLQLDAGGIVWAPFALTPADYWITFVDNRSNNNVALYNNPIVENCDYAFTTSGNLSYIQSACKAAQAQIYEDAPYAWIGVNRLWEPNGGSLVWQNSIVKGFLADPTFTGEDYLPFFNTITFV